MKDALIDIGTGVFILCVIACPVIVLRWCWEFGIRWPTYCALGLFALLILAMVGAWARDGNN